MTVDALRIWQEKLELLERELAIASDVSKKFEIEKQIEEAKRKIKELEDRAIGFTNDVDRIRHDLGAIELHTAHVLLRVTKDSRWSRLQLSDAYQPTILAGAIGDVDKAIVIRDTLASGGAKTEVARDDVVKVLVKLIAGLLEDSDTTWEYMREVCDAILDDIREPIQIGSEDANRLHLRASRKDEEGLGTLLEDIFRVDSGYNEL